MEQGTPEFITLVSGGIMILMLLSLLGNILVCCAVYYSRNLRTRVNYLIVSLACADIMIASIAMPVWMYFEITGFKNLSGAVATRIQKFWTFFDILGGIASIANLTAISYERLWSVYSPLNHRRYLTSITLMAIIAAVWSYAIFVASVPVIWWNWMDSVIFTFIAGFAIPLLQIFVCYFSIFVIVNRSSPNIISPRDNSRINRTICVIVGLFFICWAPQFVTSLLTAKCTSCFYFIINNLWIRTLFKWLHYANSCLNPLVYGIANAQYKEAFKLVFKKLCFACFFKSDTESNNGANHDIFYPRRMSETSKALVVEMTTEEKEPLGAQGGFATIDELDEERYLPGDYRALPVFRSRGETRWNAEASQSLMGRETRYNSEVSQSSIGTSVLDDTETLKRALLDPQSLSRTSYI